MTFSLLDVGVIVVAIAAVAWVLWYFLWSGDGAASPDEGAAS